VQQYPQRQKRPCLLRLRLSATECDEVGRIVTPGGDERPAGAAGRRPVDDRKQGNELLALVDDHRLVGLVKPQLAAKEGALDRDTLDE
jgi:hypothetical protein